MSAFTKLDETTVILIVMSVYLLMLSKDVNCLQTQYILFVCPAMALYSTTSLQSAVSRIYGPDYSIHTLFFSGQKSLRVEAVQILGNGHC